MSKPAQELDRLLRQKLEEVPFSQPTPDGWERLGRALDTDVDLKLRNALVGLAAEHPAAGWESLEQKLDPQGASDAALAVALNELTPAAPEGSWEVLKDKLDDSLGREVDAIVSNHLQTGASKPSGWAALAARLELISHRRQLVGAWKITEFCLLASLMLLMLRFGVNKVDITGPVAQLEGQFPILEKSLGSEDLGQEPAVVQTPAFVAPALSANLSVNPANEKEGQIKLVVPKPAELAVQLLPTPRYQAEALPEPHSLTSSSFALLDGPDYTAEWGGTLPSPSLDLPAIDNSVPVRYYLNIFASPLEVNEVITLNRFVKNLNISGRSEFTHSYSVGALLDVSKGRDGLQVGAVYGRHAYTPAELSQRDCFLTGDCTEGYEEFEYHSISFPFSYERSLFKNNNWRLATRAGMVMSVITNSEFREPENASVSIQDALDAPPLESNFGGPGLLPPPASTPISSTRLTKPEPGWFEGGSILKNASFYLEGSFTIERSLNPWVSFYLSPFYSRVVYLDAKEGVGPYNDQIHRGGIRLGSRFLLSRK